jgi:hypothetical protein
MTVDDELDDDDDDKDELIVTNNIQPSLKIHSLTLFA